MSMLIGLQRPLLGLAVLLAILSVEIEALSDKRGQHPMVTMLKQIITFLNPFPDDQRQQRGRKGMALAANPTAKDGERPSRGGGGAGRVGRDIWLTQTRNGREP